MVIERTFVVLALAGALSGCRWSLLAPNYPPDAAPRDVAPAPDVLDEPAMVTDVAVDAPGDAAADAPPDVAPACSTSSTMTTMRLANFTVGADAVDYCLHVEGQPAGSFDGPILLRFGFSEPDGGTAGLRFAELTGYVPTPPGRHQLRLVAPGQTDCATPFAGLADFAVTLGANTYNTVIFRGALGGDAGLAPEVMTIRDSHDVFNVGGVVSSDDRIRLFHAAPGEPAVSVVAFSSGRPLPTVARAPYGEIGVGMLGIPDCNGYVSAPPVTGVTVQIQDDAMRAVLRNFDITLRSGAINSAFLIGSRGQSGLYALSGLFCDDLLQTGGRASCTRFGQ